MVVKLERTALVELSDNSFFFSPTRFLQASTSLSVQNLSFSTTHLNQGKTNKLFNNKKVILLNLEANHFWKKALEKTSSSMPNHPSIDKETKAVVRDGEAEVKANVFATIEYVLYCNKLTNEKYGNTKFRIL